MISSMQLARTTFVLVAVTLVLSCLVSCKKDAPQGQSMTANGPFEGTVTFKIEDPAKPVATLVFEMKGTKLRANLPQETNQGKKGFVLYDTATKKTMLVLDDQKVFVAIDLGSANVANAFMP